MRTLKIIKSHLKKVFSPDIGVEPSSQVLDILEYACGLIFGLAFLSRRSWREISTEYPNFETVSKEFDFLRIQPGFNINASDVCKIQERYLF